MLPASQLPPRLRRKVVASYDPTRYPFASIIAQILSSDDEPSPSPHLAKIHEREECKRWLGVNEELEQELQELLEGPDLIATPSVQHASSDASFCDARRHIDTGRVRYRTTQHSRRRTQPQSVVARCFSWHRQTGENMCTCIIFLINVDEYVHCREGPNTRVHCRMSSNARMAALEAKNEGLRFRVAELEAHVSEMDAVKADMRCVRNTLASAHPTHHTSIFRVDDTSGTFKWVIKDWTKILTPSIRSVSFTIGGFNW
jgi:hypothetical protein